MYISRKRLLIMSITILMMILLSSIFGITQNDFEQKYAITTSRVNLRKQPNLDKSSIIKTIDANTNIKLINQIDNFYVVQLPNNEFGFIAKDYVKIQEQSLTKFDKYTNITNFNTIILGDQTNIRRGPGTNFAVHAILNASSNVEVIGKMENWYLLLTPNQTIGFVRDDLIEIPSTDDIENNTDSETLPNTTETILTLINNARENQGLPHFKIDDLLNSTAQAKAKDMVTNNYFSHNSPTYGSPFEMMQKAGIKYKTAGENIAGNLSVQKAVESWIASPTHKQNILSNAYNYIGIGLEKSDTYGYVIVLMFIGK